MVLYPHGLYFPSHKTDGFLLDQVEEICSLSWLRMAFVLWWWCQISVWVILKTPKLFVYFPLTAEALHPCSSGDVLHRAAGAGARCARRHQRRTVRCSQPPKPGQEERTWAAIAMVTSHQRFEGGWGDQTRQRTAERSAGSRWVKNV